MNYSPKFSTVLAIFFAAIMLTTPVAMAAPGVDSSNSGEIPDASLDEVQTQSPDEVEVSSELESEDSNGEITEVLVRLDADSSQFRSNVEDEVDSVSDEQEQLKQDAEITQQTLERYAESDEGIEIINSFWLVNAALVEIDTEETDLDDIASVDGVSELHPNYNVELVEPDGDVDSNEFGDADYTYGLEQINAPNVWDDFDTQGEDTSVAVVDTGINADHIEFADRDEIDDNWAAFDFNGLEMDTEPFDENGHGTHVAGTVLGGDASGTSIGVAPDAELIPINVFPDPDGGTTLAAIIGGLENAVEQGADVANFSLGGAGFAAIYIDLVKNAKEAGTLIVSSSGNDGPGSDGTPANVFNSSAIGATDENAQVTDFSTGSEVDTEATWGTIAPSSWPDEYVTPDFSAPGADVMSSYVPGDDEYTALSGTSMAAPHVAGAAALLMSEHDLSPSEVKDLLEETATKPNPSEISSATIGDAEMVSSGQGDNLFDDDVADVRYGYGIADVYAAFIYLDENTATIEGEVTDGEDAVGEQIVDVDDPGIRSVKTDDDGEFVVDVVAGEYEFSVDSFGETASETVSVGDGETETVSLELSNVAAVELLQSQPPEVASGDGFDIAVNAANIEEIIVDFGEDSTVSKENVTVMLGEDEIELGVPTDLTDEEDLFTGEAVISVTTDADAGESLELVHTFTGSGSDIEDVSSGVTQVLAEDAEPENVELVEFDAADEVIPSQPSLAGTVTLENPGDFTQDVTVAHSIISPPLGLFPEQVTVGAGETVEVDIGPYNWFVIGDPGISINHRVDVFQDGSTVESGVETTEFVGATGSAGTVTDVDTGEPIVGATVTVTDPAGEEFVGISGVSGEYDVGGPELPGTYTVEVAHDGYVTTETEVDVEDGPVQADVELVSDPVYEFSMDADEVYSIGIPGPIEGDTVGDVIEADTEGVIYAYDPETGGWTQAAVDDSVSALDALVVIPTEDANASIELAGDAGDSSTAAPVDRNIEEGWNFIAPSSYNTPDNAFVTTSEELRILQIGSHTEPASGMAIDGEFSDGSLFDDVGSEVVNPFSGYFVFVDDDGVHSGELYDGLSLADANERLNLDTEAFSVDIVGENSDQLITDASVTVENTSFATVSTDASTGSDGIIGLNHLPEDEEQVLSIEADGFVDDRVTADNDSSVTLQEERFFQIDDFEISETTLEPGQEFEVEYTVTNVGAETAMQAVEVEFGQNVQLARSEMDTFAISSQMIELEPGESETVTVTDVVSEQQPVAPQEVAVITNAAGADLQDTEAIDVEVIPEIDEVELSFNEQAVGVDEEGDQAVVVEDVTAEAGQYVVITEDGEDVTEVGAVQLNDRVVGEDVVVPVDDATPGTHVAHIVEDLSEFTDESADTSDEESVLVTDDADVLDAVLTFEDDSFDSETDVVTVEEASVFDGADNERNFTVDLHPTDAAGEVIADEAVGQSANLTGENTDVSIDLDENITATDEYVAMIHLGDSEEPLSTPPLTAAAGSGLAPVVDSAAVEIVPDAGFMIESLDAPESVLLGQSFEAEAAIENVGDDTATQTVTFEFDGDEIAAEDVEIEGGETETIVFGPVDSEDIGAGEFEHSVSTDDDSETAPIEITSTNVELNEQALGTDADGEDAVLVDDVSAGAGLSVVVTDTDLNEVGSVQLEESLANESVTVPVDSTAGTHVAHVTSDPNDLESMDTDSSQENLLVNDAASIFAATLEFGDQDVDAGAEEVNVSVANLVDGMDDDTEFVVDLHPTTEDGDIIGDEAVGQSETITGENEEVTIELEEELEESDEFVAMLHVGPSGEPLSTPPILTLDGDELVPVVDSGEVTVDDDEQASMTAPATVAVAGL